MPAQVTLKPGDDIQAIVEKSPAGTSFLLSRGVYRLQSITPKDNDSFFGEQGAILNGAEALNSFNRQGNYWIAKVNAQAHSDLRGFCQPAFPACKLPEDLFIDHNPRQRVLSWDEVAPGKWYLDYSSGTIYLGDDPAGHTIEISLAPRAFQGSAKNVTIRGLVIEKYACPAQVGAINGFGAGNRLSQNWLIEQNEIRFNHGTGVRTGMRMRLINNNIHHNGQIGIAGPGDSLLIQGNEIAYNNYAGYNWYWEGGGTKFVYTKNLVVRANYVHDNKGPGLWTDTENYYALYENNRTSNNLLAGIDHELSFDAIIRNNTIEHDGFNPANRGISWGAGIFIYDSSNVEVYGNTVIDCMNGIVAREDDRGMSRNGARYAVKNVNVHDNTIRQGTGFAMGLRKGGSFDDSVFTNSNNRFANNHFELTNRNGK